MEKAKKGGRRHQWRGRKKKKRIDSRFLEKKLQLGFKMEPAGRAYGQRWDYGRAECRRGGRFAPIERGKVKIGILFFF